MISAYRGSRPAPKDAAKEKQEFKADVIMIAVGQDIVSAPFEEFGIPAKWNILQAGLDTEVKEIPGVFTGGDCATGPSTVRPIRSRIFSFGSGTTASQVSVWW